MMRCFFEYRSSNVFFLAPVGLSWAQTLFKEMGSWGGGEAGDASFRVKTSARNFVFHIIIPLALHEPRHKDDVVSLALSALGSASSVALCCFACHCRLRLHRSVTEDRLG